MVTQISGLILQIKPHQVLTQVSGLIEVVSIHKNENLNTVMPFHHPLTIQSSFIKKQRASTDTCLLTNGHSYHFLWSICWLYIIQSRSYPSYSSISINIFSLQANGSVRGMMMDGNMFVNSLHSTHWFSET